MSRNRCRRRVWYILLGKHISDQAKWLTVYAKAKIWTLWLIGPINRNYLFAFVCFFVCLSVCSAPVLRQQLMAAIRMSLYVWIPWEGRPVRTVVPMPPLPVSISTPWRPRNPATYSKVSCPKYNPRRHAKQSQMPPLSRLGRGYGTRVLFAIYPVIRKSKDEMDRPLLMFEICLSLFSEFRSSPTPSPYATALLPMGDQIAETIYSKPESVCPSRISYYASSQLTQVCVPLH